MKVFRYIDGVRYTAEAPDDATPIYLGPQAGRDSKITQINWDKKYYTEQVIVPFPAKWYRPDDLIWTEDPHAEV